MAAVAISSEQRGIPAVGGHGLAANRSQHRALDIRWGCRRPASRLATRGHGRLVGETGQGGPDPLGQCRSVPVFIDQQGSL